jgi:Mlc titration factor MtfA (ptsG expression regulator)
MVKGVEFSGVANLDKEVLRMPLLTLHELAHAYHDQVLGFNHPEIKACYDQAVTNKSYDNVSRKNWQGKITEGVKAYAMTTPMEYFSETTEALFGQNDFFPYNRKELEAHDPAMVAVLKKAWGTP